MSIPKRRKADLNMRFYLSGIHVPHRKKTAGTPPAVMSTPKCVVLPTSMHIGKPAKPVVRVGDDVFVGTLVAEQDGFVSSPVYSSVSGKVEKISEILMANGTKGTAITVSSDGNMTPDPSIAPPQVHSREDLIEAIRASGIVGLGGAGFPTYVKFNVPTERIEELIINGAECEPYITSDTHTMVARVDDMAIALEAMEKWLGIKSGRFSER